MILAELEVFHSRAYAPTRRVALGHLHLPSDPAPGPGGLLLGAVVASSIAQLDPAFFDELDQLARQLERGRRISQPRLRHRFQTDQVGLLRSHHQLVAEGDQLRFNLDDRGTAAQNVLAAVYAAGRLPAGPRSRVIGVVRRAMRWSGPVDHTLVAHLVGSGNGHPWSAHRHRDPLAWALTVMGLATERVGAPPPTRGAIQTRFRELLRQAHPDHGGRSADAAIRISELAEARRILLAATR